MLNSRQIPWPRIFAEGAAIVISILLAFSIDAWWSDRQLHDEEREVLANLLTEFNRLESEIHDSRRFYSGIRSSALALIEIGVGTRDAVDDEEIDRLFSGILFYGNTWTWISSNLDSAISSGDITLVSNSDLRQRLGRLAAQLGIVREMVDIDMTFYRNRLRPYLSTNMYLPQITNWSQPIPGLPERKPYDFGGVTLRVPSNPRHRELVSREEFQNLIWERAGYLNDILFVGIGFEEENNESLSSLGKDLEATIAIIESELATP